MEHFGMKAKGNDRPKLDVVRAFQFLQAVRCSGPMVEEYNGHVVDALFARLEPDGTLLKERVRLVLPEALRRRTSKTHETRAAKVSWRRKNHETTRDPHRRDVSSIDTPASSSHAGHGTEEAPITDSVEWQSARGGFEDIPQYRDAAVEEEVPVWRTQTTFVSRPGRGNAKSTRGYVADVRPEDGEGPASGEDDTPVVHSAAKKRKAVPGNEKTGAGKKDGTPSCLTRIRVRLSPPGVKQRDLQQRQKIRLRQEGVHLE